MREQPTITGEHLRDCLQEHYGLIPTSIDFLPLGADYRAGVYHIVSQHGSSYLLKVKSGAFYEPGCLVPTYLKDQGIASVIAPIPTRDHTLWTAVAGWTLIVYPFLTGETSWEGMTDEQWKETGLIFKQIHQVIPPSDPGSLRKENFDPTSYAQWIQTFESQHLYESSGTSASRQALRATWIASQSTIHAVLASLEKLAGTLQRRNLPFVICHADLHPANLLRDSSGHVFIIDWDEVMLAPRERDFIFIKASSDDSKILPGASTFFQGYGPTDIDWAALTYYRYERVLQDIIACAEHVCLRDDLGEEARADEVQLFQAILTQDSELDAAIHASTHLPSEFSVPIKRDGTTLN